MNTRILRRLLALALVVALVAGLGITQVLAAAPSTSTYDSGDVAAINAMIENNGLKATKDAPDTWDFVMWRAPFGTTKEVFRLYLTQKGLTGTLDVSDLAGLSYLDCNDNQLTGLDVSGLPSLTNLNCNTNQLKSLDVSGNTFMVSLLCSGNQLTSLDVSGNIYLTDLRCSGNQLKSLDVSMLTRLGSLECGKNLLTDLDVSMLTNLAGLECGKNPLTNLDASMLTDMSALELDLSQPLRVMTPNSGNVLTVNPSGGGGYVSLDFTKQHLTLTARPDEDKGYSFGAWRFSPPVPNLDNSGERARYAIALDKDVTVSASFVRSSGGTDSNSSSSSKSSSDVVVVVEEEDAATSKKNPDTGGYNLFS